AKLEMTAQAVEYSEQRLARRLAESLGRRGALLDRARNEDRTKFEALRDRIAILEAEARTVGRTASRDYGAITADLRTVREEISRLLARIGEYLPGFLPSGLSFPEIGELVQAIGQPLVYLIGTSHGALALLVGEGGTEKA